MGKLKKDQTDSRFQFQQERITDREQQLTSLYTAFGLISEECTEQEVERAALQSILGEADSRVARRLQDEMESKTTRRMASPTNTNTPSSGTATTNLSTPQTESP